MTLCDQMLLDILTMQNSEDMTHNNFYHMSSLRLHFI